jgi:hypothetical protein
MHASRGLVVALLAVTVRAHAACDVAGADASAISAAWDAIDAACPCAAATNRAAYRACARDAVTAQVTAAALPRGCRSKALRYASLSICGRPGAAVCCRVRDNGRTRHRIVSDAADCLATARTTACVSTWQSVLTGCDATGCVPLPVCGNGIVERGEQCDPPDISGCDLACHTFSCAPPPTTCGNGILDAGEACEPPGVGACGRDCQLAPCAPSGVGEIGIACVPDNTTVTVGATSGGYLIGWSGRQAREQADVLVRRFDPNGAPVDVGLTVASGDAPCTAAHTDPSIASDGGQYYALWSSLGDLPGNGNSGFLYEAVFGRRLGEVAGNETLDQLALISPAGVGTCEIHVSGPTTAAGMSPSHFAVGWDETAGCAGGVFHFENPGGDVLAFTPSLVATSLPLGFPSALPPSTLSTSPASVASLAGDTLWVWQAVFATTAVGPYAPFLAGAWTDLLGGTTRFTLTGRAVVLAGRPAVAAGASSFLIAWSQGATDTATAPTEIRAVRATRAAGSLDPNGGLLLATAGGPIEGGPAVGFDGTRWLVVWTEGSGTGADLRAVAVRDDGTVVDASPRLVAANVAMRDPAAASVGDGRVLVVFVRPDGGNSAVRAVLVTP